MKLGIHFPQAEIGTDFKVIREFVMRAEAIGFDHINVPDHVIQTRTPRADFPAAANYTTEFPHHEVMTVLAFIAGVTERMRLKSAVLILPQRQAVLVAKQAAEIDVLSGGRMQLGVGLGWNAPEYAALDMNFKNRAKRFVEQIEVCRKLWSEQHPSFSGQWHTFEDAGLAPMPIQRPIPIWVGAFAEPAILRAAAIADGWQAMLPMPDDNAAAVFNRFRAEVEKNGRNPSEVGIEATIFTQKIAPEDWLAQAQQWREIGATQVMFRPQGAFEFIREATEAYGELLSELRG